MTWPYLLILIVFIGLPGGLFFGYCIGIQYQRDAWWLWVRCICAIVLTWALVIDVAANWTSLSVYFWEFPREPPDVDSTEWTFSERLERLVLTDGWRGRIALAIARFLNRVAPPGHPHIKNAVGR